MITKSEIKNIVYAHWLWQFENIYKKSRRSHAKLPKLKMPGPAKEKEIVAFEKKQGWKFPPSYREFLRVYNGWPISDDSVLTGVSGPVTRKTQKTIREYISHQSGKSKASGIPNRRYFGVGMAGGLLFFIPNKKSSNGEMRVGRSYFQFKPRLKLYKNFPAFLKEFTHYKSH